MNGWKALGFESYADYLVSDIWISTRDYFLKLNPTCQECHNNEATQVHHKSYANVGNEGSEELLVVCKSCHEKIHKLGVKGWKQT